MLALYLAYLDDDNDKLLFERIYLAYRKQMVVLALSISGSKADAEDIVGDVFLKIAQRNWDAVRSIENKTDLRNYLLKATKNTALNRVKARKRENVSIDTISERDMDNAENLSDDSFVEFICSRFEYYEVVSAIRSLGEKYRDTLYCHYVVEMTVPQTAKFLEQTVSATKQQLVRGKKLLLSRLGNTGE